MKISEELQRISKELQQISSSGDVSDKQSKQPPTGIGQELRCVCENSKSLPKPESDSPTPMEKLAVILRLTLAQKQRILSFWMEEHIVDDSKHFIYDAIWDGYTGYKGQSETDTMNEWNQLLEPYLFAPTEATVDEINDSIRTILDILYRYYLMIPAEER